MDNINIDNADRKVINVHTGYMVGFNSEIIALNNLHAELVDRFKDYLAVAKGVLVSSLVGVKCNLRVH
jgi:hypothetical protein